MLARDASPRRERRRHESHVCHCPVQPDRVPQSAEELVPRGSGARVGAADVIAKTEQDALAPVADIER